MVSITVQGTTLAEVTATFIRLGQAFEASERVAEATAKLKEGTDVLKQAVEANQP